MYFQYSVDTWGLARLRCAPHACGSMKENEEETWDKLTLNLLTKQP